MPRRSLLTPTERATLLALPSTEDEWIRHYTLTEPDLAVIEQRRGNANRLGFAIQLCYLRFPGFALPVEGAPPSEILAFVARQLHLKPDLWSEYAQRAETRREHLLELQDWLQLTSFGSEHASALLEQLTAIVEQTDQGIVLATALIERLRAQSVILPGIEVIERVCAEALTLGTRRVYEALGQSLSAGQRQAIDGLLRARPGFQASVLAWLRQPAGKPKAKYILTHLERLKVIQDLGLPVGLVVHQNWLAKLVSESKQMSARHLRELEPARRYATLAVLLLDIRATLIDETIDLHERLLSSLFNGAKHRHAERFQESGKSINDKLRLLMQIGQALLEARQTGGDPFVAIEALLSWEAFSEMLTETEKLARPATFDFLPLLSENFSQLRRYTPTLLEQLPFRAIPVARPLLEGIEVLKDMNQREKYEIPETAPMAFVRKRWKPLVKPETGLDRRFYELCVLSEVKNALRAGDMWVEGSRQFKAFEDYILPVEVLAHPEALGLAIETDCERYLEARLALLNQQLQIVERLAAQNALPDTTVIAGKRLKISPLEKTVPAEAEALMRQAYGLLPHVKITELLLEVEAWTGFSRHFTHLKTGEPAENRELLLTALLADGINLGLTKMAEACPGATYAKLSWLQAWHVRDETYAAALAELVNAQFHHPLASLWGDGTTSSSDGQRFKAGGRGEFAGQVNPKYGSEPGVLFYTHVSDQYAPFHTQVIHTPLGEATHVLDGLLYHQSELQIKEHYTDTAGFTEHVFALMHLLGFRFAPRIKDLADKKLYVPGDPKQYPTLAGLIGERLQLKQIRTHWGDILRLAASVKQGKVTASLILRKLGSYPRQNSLALALRELGRIERTLFMLEWYQDPELRRRVHAGLNKGESRNSLARAVFFHRLGEIRDRRFESQRYRASGLNLVVAAIILWNTVYLERAIQALREKGQTIDDDLLSHLSPLGWEHINLTGDYTWRQSKQVERGRFRHLRSSKEP